MEVLEDQWERVLAPVVLLRFADAAAGGRRPVGLVVRPPVVVAGEAEAAGRPQDQKRRVEGQPSGPPRRQGAEDGVVRLAEDQGRVHGRQVALELEVGVLEGGPGGVDDEGRQAKEDGKGLAPPAVGPGSPQEPAPRHRRGRRYRREGAFHLGGEASSRLGGTGGRPSSGRRRNRRRALDQRRPPAMASGWPDRRAV